MINKLKSAAAFGVCLMTVTLANAAVDTEIQGIVTDASSLWTSVKALIVGIVAVLIGVWVVKKIRAR